MHSLDTPLQMHFDYSMLKIVQVEHATRFNKDTHKMQTMVNPLILKFK